MNNLEDSLANASRKVELLEKHSRKIVAQIEKQEDKILWFDNEVFHLRMELDEAKKAKKEEALEEKKGTKDKFNTSTKQAL